MYDECVGDAQSRECIDILYASKVLDWFRNQTKYRHNQYWFSHQTLQKLYSFFGRDFFVPILFLAILWKALNIIFLYFHFSKHIATYRWTIASIAGVNKNRKLVAFAQRGNRPHVIVYDLEARKRAAVLRCAEFVSGTHLNHKRTFKYELIRMYYLHYVTYMTDVINVHLLLTYSTEQVISLAFSHDSKYLLAMGGEPDFR